MSTRYAIRDFQRSDGTVPIAEWLGKLRDARAKARIWQRLSRMECGNFGDHRSVGGGVWEMRIDYGPGYRIYYAIYEHVVVLLLCGGDKDSQQQDIITAKEYKKLYEAKK